MISLEKQVEIAEKISKTISASSGVPYNDLLSEAMFKIPLIQKNYIGRISNNYTSYLKTSLRGYLKNYIRDHSFSVRIPRRTLDIYMKTRNYSSHLIASLHTKWSESEIRDAHESVRKHRAYNMNQVQSWSTEIETMSSRNEFSEATMLCEEAEVDRDMLIDHFVNELPPEEMKELYGEGYLYQVGVQSRRLKKLAVHQGYNDEKT